MANSRDSISVSFEAMSINKSVIVLLRVTIESLAEDPIKIHWANCALRDSISWLARSSKWTVPARTNSTESNTTWVAKWSFCSKSKAASREVTFAFRTTISPWAVVKSNSVASNTICNAASAALKVSICPFNWTIWACRLAIKIASAAESALAVDKSLSKSATSVVKSAISSI